MLALSHDGDRFLVGSRVALSVLSTESGAELGDPLYLGRRRAIFASFSPAESVALVARPLDGAINSGGEIFAGGRFSRELAQGVQMMAFLPDNPQGVLTAGARGVQIWSPPKGELLRTITDAPADRVAVDARGGLVAISLTVGSDKAPATQLEVRSLEGREVIQSGRQNGRTYGLDLQWPDRAVLWGRKRLSTTCAHRAGSN